MAQKRNLPLPDYDFDSAEKASSLGFPFVCTVKAFGASAQGGGKNKKEAKQEAAKELWMMVEENERPKVTITTTTTAIASTTPSVAAAKLVLSSESVNRTTSLLAFSDEKKNLEDSSLASTGKGCVLSAVSTKAKNLVVSPLSSKSPADEDSLSAANSELSFQSLSPEPSVKTKHASTNLEDDDNGVDDGVDYVDDGVNYVGKLQEESVRRCIGAPRYEESLTLIGQKFSVRASLSSLEISARGFGKRKKDAKNAAAKGLYVKLMASCSQEQKSVEIPTLGGSKDGNESANQSSVFRPQLQPVKLDFSVDSEVEVVKKSADGEVEVVEKSAEGEVEVDKKRIDGEVVLVKKSADGEAEVVKERVNLPMFLKPASLTSNDGSRDDVNYIGRLKEYLDKKTYGQARYEDDIGSNGVSAVIVVEGVKLVGRSSTGLSSKKKMRQSAAKDLLHQLCPIVVPIPCSPIGLVVGMSPARRRNRQSDAIFDEEDDALTSVSLSTPTTSAGDLVDSAVDLENAEDELDQLVDDLDLPTPEFKISKIKTKGEIDKTLHNHNNNNNKTLHTCVIGIEGERDSVGSGYSRLEATQRAACNMVLHLRYKHNIARKDSGGERSEGVKDDSALGMSSCKESGDSRSSPLQKQHLIIALDNESNSASKFSSKQESMSVKDPPSAKGGPLPPPHPFQVSRGYGGSEPRLNLLHLRTPTPRPDIVVDKTSLMTLADKRDEAEVGLPLTKRLRRVSDPGAIARVFFNSDQSGIPACYAAFKEVLNNNNGDASDCFRDLADRSASATRQRRKILEDAGVGVTLEPVLRERATGKREVVRGESAGDGVLCFLKLNFEPNYEEVEEFQWNRKRRFDKQLLFGGKGSTMPEAEADAFVRAAEHLKTTTDRL